MEVRQRLRKLLALAIAAAAISLACQNCVAQVRRYEPQTPTLSPYLGLSLFNNGSVPNYYAFVRPRLQQRALNLQEQALTRQNAGQIQRLENDVQRGIVPVAQTGTGSWFLTPGTRTTYLDTTRYYPAANVGGRR
jgi:hypothetical protein